MNAKDRKIIAKREANLKRRLDREVKEGQGEKPMLGDLNIHYEMGDRTRAIDCVEEVFEKVLVRGDTDFSLTKHFDRWDERAAFIFGYKAYENVIRLAEELPKNAWKRLKRPPKYTVKTRARDRPENVKERIVREREYENFRLVCEPVAEFEYRPGSCEKTYRMVAVRKNLSVEKGERPLFDEILYFLYITNDWDSPAEEIVFSANERCDRENIIAQLKSGIHALRMPSGDLYSNWAYMVIASLAWTLKAWYALLAPDKKQRRRALRMEFKSFARRYVNIPCQIVRTGRRLVYRILGYNRELETFLQTFDRIRAFTFT